MRSLRILLTGLTFLLSSAAFAIGPVDINSADAETLATAMKGVGVKKAEAIVAYRDQHGPFKSVDELTLVRGIGEKTVESSRDNLTIESTTNHN